MAIILPPEIEDFLHKKVNGGKYCTPIDVLEDALGLLEERDSSQEQRLDALREKIAIGIEQADRGELFDAEQFFDELELKIQSKSASQQ